MKKLILLITITLSTISYAQLTKEDFKEFIGDVNYKYLTFNTVTKHYAQIASDKISDNEFYILTEITYLKLKESGVQFKTVTGEHYLIPFNRIKMLSTDKTTISIYNE